MKNAKYLNATIFPTPIGFTLFLSKLFIKYTLFINTVVAIS